MPNNPRTRSEREELWRSWKNYEIDGVLAQIWDEQILRREPSLRRYWKLRSFGRYKDAVIEFERNSDEICLTSMIEFGEKKIMSNLCFRMEDLRMLSFANQSPFIHYNDPSDEDLKDAKKPQFLMDKNSQIRVVGLDSGTWPADAGGVTMCRSDLVDGMSRIRWNMFPEVGNVSKEMRRQFQENVESMNFIWLWGCSLDGPNERTLSAVPYGKLVGKKFRTTDNVLRNRWSPLLAKFVVACGQNHAYFPSKERFDIWTKLIAEIHIYFEECDWTITWDSPVSLATWRKCWAGFHGKSKLMHAEYPTIEG